ncbi:hypothetical protein AB0J35_36275 [Nonomuraea angiospora]|uniref:hypothetical protein n=1 Tax=Nonomuraea angiospora TaxID=46172 RepID=UPI00341F8E23
MGSRRSPVSRGSRALTKAGLSPLADALFENAEAHLAADAKLLEDIQRLLDRSGRGQGGGQQDDTERPHQ